jgi:hypothetical protein
MVSEPLRQKTERDERTQQGMGRGSVKRKAATRWPETIWG